MARSRSDARRCQRLSKSKARTTQDPGGITAGVCIHKPCFRLSWNEVALPAHHDRQDALVTDGVGSGRARTVLSQHSRTRISGIELRVEHVNTDVDVRMRVPLRPSTD